MKTFFTTFGLLVFVLFANAQKENPKYNKMLADSLGADKYGMKMYTLVILKTGKTDLADKAKRDSLFRGHLSNIGRLADVGKLIVAGPLKKNNNNYEGIFILNVQTDAEAMELLQTDPAIRAKLLDVELFQWYGSAALPLYLNFHNSVKKIDF
ncbi:YciI family protein [Danxiaibacter flavus]|uniref:YciI family protein n=1 Tax=Danxiaibacter flavus TaxID=3049108 RepID=A0ABV3ZFD2_9BACT|nr:YciI family protein [Chitinophagaceae bacterium DXS]